MSAHTFACPLCSQHIQCDDQYAGKQIKCPLCQGDILIPELPPAAPAPRVSVRTVHTTAPHSPPASPGFRAPPMPHSAPATEEAPRGGKARTIALVAVLVIIGVPAVYYGFRAVGKMQAKWNENRAKDDEPTALGGQLGHIAELNAVLDATDPARFSPRPGDDEPEPGRTGKGPRSRSVAVGAGGGGAEQSAAEALNKLPVIPPQWTMNLTNASIPESKVNGRISGTNFVADITWLMTGGATPVLSLRQGTNASPERELLVYLRLKPGESLAGKTWTITPDQRAGVPQVIKKWKTNPKYAPDKKSFPSGYAMKLELGQAEDETLPGKIFIALPDPEKTVVAGRFYAAIRVVGAAAAQSRPTFGSSYADE